MLAMFDEVVVSQEWYCKWNVRLGRSQVAVLECFVDVVEGSTATWLFKIGSHTSDGVKLKMCTISGVVEVARVAGGGKLRVAFCTRLGMVMQWYW